MKVSYLASTNVKGQVVIPKVLRDALAITPEKTLNIIPSSSGLYMYPVSEVMTSVETESAFVSLLRSTQGGWGEETLAEKNQSLKRQKIETAATQQRKAAW